MKRRSLAIDQLLLTLALVCGCQPDECDIQDKAAQLMSDDVMDCGTWTREDSDEPLLMCASDAAAEGRDIRFEWTNERSHIIIFTKDGNFYTLHEIIDPFYARFNVRMHVNACDQTLPELLESFRSSIAPCMRDICIVCPESSATECILE